MGLLFIHWFFHSVKHVLSAWYIGWLAKPLRVLCDGKKCRCKTLCTNTPHIPVSSGCFPICYDTFGLGWTKFSEVHYACLCVSLALTFGSSQERTLVEPSELGGKKSQKSGFCWPEKFPVVWQITISHTALMTELKISLLIGLAAASGCFFHVSKNMLLYWFFRLKYKLLTFSHEGWGFSTLVLSILPK